MEKWVYYVGLIHEVRLGNDQGMVELRNQVHSAVVDILFGWISV